MMVWYSHLFKSFSVYYPIHRASLVAHLVKNLPAMWGTWVQSLGWEDPLEKETVTHSNRLSQSFDIVDETEIDVFLEFPSFIYDPANVGSLISGSSSFLNPVSKFSSFSKLNFIK